MCSFHSEMGNLWTFKDMIVQANQKSTFILILSFLSSTNIFN